MSCQLSRPPVWQNCFLPHSLHAVSIASFTGWSSRPPPRCIRTCACSLMPVPTTLFFTARIACRA